MIISHFILGQGVHIVFMGDFQDFLGPISRTFLIDFKDFLFHIAKLMGVDF